MKNESLLVFKHHILPFAFGAATFQSGGSIFGQI
jgi:hypothetical protein